MKALYWDRTGPRVNYEGGLFSVDDLNPETSIKFKLSRWEAFALGCYLAWRALTS